MKPTQELIWALRRAAKRIVDPKEDYLWNDASRCNCGLLARELLGFSKEEAFQKMRFIGEWTSRACLAKQCPSSGFFVDDLFHRLIEAGLDWEDFNRIEYLRDDNFLLVYGDRFNQRENVADYFGKLADSLELQLKGKIESRDPISTEEPTRARIALEGVEV